MKMDWLLKLPHFLHYSTATFAYLEACLAIEKKGLSSFWHVVWVVHYEKASFNLARQCLHYPEKQSRVEKLIQKRGKGKSFFPPWMHNFPPSKKVAGPTFSSSSLHKSFFSLLQVCLQRKGKKSFQANFRKRDAHEESDNLVKNDCNKDQKKISPWNPDAHSFLLPFFRKVEQPKFRQFEPVGAKLYVGCCLQVLSSWQMFLMTHLQEACTKD